MSRWSRDGKRWGAKYLTRLQKSEMGIELTAMRMVAVEIKG
jgi:hypothetical protein